MTIPAYMRDLKVKVDKIEIVEGPPPSPKRASKECPVLKALEALVQKIGPGHFTLPAGSYALSTIRMKIVAFKKAHPGDISLLQAWEGEDGIIVVNKGA